MEENKMEKDKLVIEQLYHREFYEDCLVEESFIINGIRCCRDSLVESRDLLGWTYYSEFQQDFIDVESEETIEALEAAYARWREEMYDIG